MKHAELSKQPAVKPLETRHVFLDTQVYRALRHNPDNPALKALLTHIHEHRIVLHIADITFLEIRRQLLEEAQKRSRELGAIEKDLRRWRKQAPSVTPKAPLEIDATKIGSQLFRTFHSFIVGNCQATLHRALIEVDAADVFSLYFSRKAPFDREDSKEFPDAFVILALSNWAKKSDENIYVVTADNAIGRAVEHDPNLLQINTIQDVLARAAADIEPEISTQSEALLNTPNFDTSFALLLKEQIKDAAFIYTGDLPEGEAFEGELLNIESIDDWTLVGRSKKRISLILSTRINVSVEVQYEDRTSASYDREDDIWIGGESAAMELEDEVSVEALVEIDCNSGETVRCQLLVNDICISGPYEDYG
jgi:hypothetical protein